MIRGSDDRAGYVLVDALVALVLSAIVIVAAQITLGATANLYQRFDIASEQRASVLRARQSLEGAFQRAHVAMRISTRSAVFSEQRLDLAGGKWTAAGLLNLSVQRLTDDKSALFASFSEEPTRSRVVLENARSIELLAVVGSHQTPLGSSSRQLAMPDVLAVRVRFRDSSEISFLVALPAYDDPRCAAAPFEQRCLRP